MRGSSSAGLMLTVVAVDGPQAAFHQRVLAEAGQHLPAVRRDARLGQPDTGARKVIELVTVLPEQLARGHLVLVQLPHPQDQGRQAQDERERIAEGDAARER